jgi:bifunctional DNA-binding transcriptional regulator/antitoxin component of YhaV-PrlF toxin-antitoxin module
LESEKKLPSEVYRKIMKHGSSGVVAIPMPYRRYHNINPGDVVQVIYDGVLIIVPQGVEEISVAKRELIEKILES